MFQSIVSGGQTGVDRAALDWAMAHGIDHGGWCPKGRRAEDGPIDPRYLLRETGTPNYLERTRLNVEEGDATLILNLEPMRGGTLSTQGFVEASGKPGYVVQLDPEPDDAMVVDVLGWLECHSVAVLNVVGPRESEHSGVYGAHNPIPRPAVDGVGPINQASIGDTKHERKNRRKRRPRNEDLPGFL